MSGARLRHDRRRRCRRSGAATREFITATWCWPRWEAHWHEGLRSSRMTTTAPRPPRRRRSVTLTIDGIAVTVPAGTSVMRAALEAGITRPQALRDRQRRGLRLLPSVPGRDRGPRAAPGLLHHAGRAGMVVHTQTEQLKKLRRGVMELYISDHPLDCLTCAANGDCELQDMAGAVGLRDVRYDATATTISRRETPPARPIRSDCRRTSPTPISPSIRRSASSARAACAPAKRCRAPSR